VRYQILVFAVAGVTLAGCGGGGSEPGAESESAAAAPAAPAAPMPELPQMIVADRGGFIPEGIEYDATHHRILTGSLSEGTIFEIHEDGTVTPFATDPDLVSSVGVEVDEPRDRLLVANSDRSVFGGAGSGQAKLGVYDLTSGARIAMVDLAAAIENPPADAVYFANDVAVGYDGQAYVTDTRMNVIYQVGTNFEASVLHRFEPRPGLGLNGIVFTSDYLLVAGGSTLYKVPVNDPSATTEVTLPEPVEGQDGMVWLGDGRLAIVSNSASRVVALRSDDNWATAQLAGIATYDGQATTAAVVGDKVHVIHPHFADADPPSVERVTFQ
jgi:hypothetical protein